MLAELLDFLGAPIGHDFFGEIRSPIKVSATKIEDERARDDGHIENQQIVVVSAQLRHMTATDHFHAMFHQAKIHISFAEVRFLLAVHFESRLTRFVLAHCG